ncbi:Hypothetical_protein [Hexamita inflata]|uniref:Hypothetical_protein n=1 Tax=Hexamita inflata TaxID=28002 RepID=A0ABP1HED0_9EUKA
MQYNDSISIQNSEFDQNLTSNVNFEPQFTDQSEQIFLNRTKWCIISWISPMIFVFSMCGAVYLIYYINEFYSVWSCLILSQCILMLLVSIFGIFFSVYECYKVKSVSVICLCKAKHKIL